MLPSITAHQRQSHKTGRYNIGDVPGGVPFPSLSYAIEETPHEELVDDADETALRERIFDVYQIPAPDFSPDVTPIDESQYYPSQHQQSVSGAIYSNSLTSGAGTVGILGIAVEHGFEGGQEDADKAMVQAGQTSRS